MPTEREAIAKREAWRKKKAAMGDDCYHDHGLYGRWRCMATIVTRPCTCSSVVVDKKTGEVFCYDCGEPASDAAKLLSIKESE